MKKVILTGADGFIGQHAIRPLLAKRYEVHAVSNVEPPAELIFENVVWHKTDLLNAESIRNLTKLVRASHLLHFAWYVEHGKFWTSEKNKLWVDASLDLIKGFVENGGERIVVSGSCVEYQLDNDEYLSENSTPLNPQTLYGKCKVELQQRIAEMDLNWAWGRIFFLFGDNEHPDRLISSVINSLLDDEFADCSHGEQIRDFMYVKDVAEAFVTLLDSQVFGSVNIGSGEARTIKEVVQKVANQMGKPEKIRFGKVPVSDNEPKRIVADTLRLRNEVKWERQRNLKQGIEETINWWRKHRQI